jgi:hypothetical protein
MKTTQTLDDILGQEIWDSRDLFERLDELEADEDRDEDEETELARLKAVAAEGETFADWSYGEGFIRDSYFTEYAQDLAEDIGAVQADASWPNSYIDWEAAAEALKMDYTSIEIDGVTFWARS